MLRRVSRWREVSNMVALTAPLDGTPPRLLARHFLGSIGAAEVITALRYFHRRLGQPWLIPWDHLGAHTARRTAAFAAAHPADFQIEWLPGHAPDLNPEEPCNQWVKHDMANALPASIDQLRRVARGRFARLRHRPDVLPSCFEHAGLVLN